MHPRNPYRTPPDFVSLAETYSPLKPHLITTSVGVTINFKDDVAQRCLTQALLCRDFGLKLTLPDDRLCPPVPNRLNYILWLQDIVDVTLTTEFPQPNSRPVRGADIGTGASAIYPLLGCKTMPSWSFTATDIDETSLKYAATNVRQNDLQDRITLVKSKVDGPVFQPLFSEEAGVSGQGSHDTFDFTMCNPPFYGSKEEVMRSAEAKEFGPNAVCTGADVEMITAGGEAAFVCKMVRESITLKTRCRWYTSMLGKMASLTDVVSLLRSEEVDNYAITEFVQGQTRRWAIAWSFGDIHLPDSFGRVSSPSLQNLMPPRNTLLQSFSPAETNCTELRGVLIEVLASIDDISVTSLNTPASQDATAFYVTATRNTWSRAARRKKKNAQTSSPPSQLMNTDVLITCKIGIVSSNEPGSLAIQFDWARGHSKERQVWESFVSHVERKVKAALADTRRAGHDIDVDME